jgi:hypothetical protein
MYTTATAPMNPHNTVARLSESQGARRSADTSKTTLKCTMVGVEYTAPTWAARTGGRAAISVMTTNCSPINAPPAEPTMT